MSKVFTWNPRISDIVKWEASYQYCREEMTVTASTTDVTILPGETYIKSTGTKFTGASEAIPAIYTVTITKSGDATASNTFIVGGVTFTFKASPSTAEGTTELALDATAAEIAAIVAAKGVTNYTVTASDNTVVYTQTTAGTGSAITVGSGTETNCTATVVTTQSYTPAASTDFDAITLYREVIPAGETRVVTVLVCGPSLVDIDNVMKVNSGNTRQATINRLKELGIKISTEPSVTYYQET